MRATQLYFATLKETPADAEVISQQLMIRAGMVRKLAAGIYTWLPLGLRVLRKVESIIREEMVLIGAQEILMPMIQPAELWQETNRWDAYGMELCKLQDRHQRNFCLGPTHEEVVTDLIRREVRSYKQLPITFYQIQTKFRDEIRPRFGLMRGREFIMKDAYSFHANQDSLTTTYQAMYGAYERIFTRLGLRFKIVQADSGNIGGQTSHEFQVLAETGEDVIAFSEQSNYAANIELACHQLAEKAPIEPSQALEKVHKSQLKSGAGQIPNLKLIVVAGSTHEMVGLLLRSEHTLNKLKAAKLPEILGPLQIIAPELIEHRFGCAHKFLGPVGIDIPLIADHDAMQLVDFTCGANELDYYFQGVNWNRDVNLIGVADLRQVVAGDTSPDGQGYLQLTRGIEIGHIFQLDTKYSRAMQALFADASGEAQALKMGCYGIGVSRIISAAIEQCHDEQGICWPAAMAPFQVIIVPIGYYQVELVRHKADTLYKQLIVAGLDVLLDDRSIRSGIALKEAALIGIPHRLVLTELGLEKGQIEYKSRQDVHCQWVEEANLLSFLQKVCYGN